MTQSQVCSVLWVMHRVFTAISERLQCNGLYSLLWVYIFTFLQSSMNERIDSIDQSVNYVARACTNKKLKACVSSELVFLRYTQWNKWVIHLKQINSIKLRINCSNQPSSAEYEVNCMIGVRWYELIVQASLHMLSTKWGACPTTDVMLRSTCLWKIESQQRTNNIEAICIFWSIHFLIDSPT